MSRPRILILWLVASMLIGSGAQAQRGQPNASTDNTLPPALKNVGIDQKLDAQLPLDLVFNDEDGNSVRLGDLMQGRPVVLSLVYYECPMLCTIVLNDMLRSFSAIPMLIGKDYDVITISFDPRDTPALAAEKKNRYVRTYAKGERAAAEASARAGWRFLTGSEDSIRRITDAVGFRYVWDEKSRQFFHPSGVTVLTPKGKIARYFFGIDYDPTDLRLALSEASNNKIGKLTDKVLLYCFHYDASTGKYTVAIMRAVRVAGIITVIAMVGGIMWMLRRDRNRSDMGVTT